MSSFRRGDVAFLWHDTLANFFTFDRDLDGFMTTDEFLAIGWGKNLGLRSVRAFDDDADGRFPSQNFDARRLPTRRPIG